MRRSTAAALGTLAGAALIVGVRLSVSTPQVTAAPPAENVAANSTPKPKPSSSASKKPPTRAAEDAEENQDNADAAGLKDGTYKGDPSDYAYGSIQVSIRISDGKIESADATFPRTGASATINPPAIAKLREQTLQVETADDLDAISGATLTVGSYKQSLQSALDAAGA